MSLHLLPLDKRQAIIDDLELRAQGSLAPHYNPELATHLEFMSSSCHAVVSRLVGNDPSVSVSLEPCPLEGLEEYTASAAGIFVRGYIPQAA